MLSPRLQNQPTGAAAASAAAAEANHDDHSDDDDDTDQAACGGVTPSGSGTEIDQLVTPLGKGGAVPVTPTNNTNTNANASFETPRSSDVVVSLPIDI